MTPGRKFDFFWTPTKKGRDAERKSPKKRPRARRHGSDEGGDETERAATKILTRTAPTRLRYHWLTKRAALSIIVGAAAAAAGEQTPSAWIALPPLLRSGGRRSCRHPGRRRGHGRGRGHDLGYERHRRRQRRRRRRRRRRHHRRPLLSRFALPHSWRRRHRRAGFHPPLFLQISRRPRPRPRRQQEWCAHPRDDCAGHSRRGKASAFLRPRALRLPESVMVRGVKQPSRSAAAASAEAGAALASIAGAERSLGAAVAITAAVVVQ